MTATLSLSHCFLTVDDQEKALRFYRDVIGLEVADDVTMDGYRWLTVTAPGTPGVLIGLQKVEAYPDMSAEDVEAARQLLAKGYLAPLILATDDVDGLFERVAASGAEVLQEPADQFYGVRDCAFRDPSGNMVRFSQPRPGGDHPPAPGV